MKYEKYLLIKLAEEASEIAQAAIKCSLFGYDSKDPRETDGDTNLFKLHKEMMDMTAVLTELAETESFNNPNEDFDADKYIESKQKKLNYYYGIASNQTS